MFNKVLEILRADGSARKISGYKFSLPKPNSKKYQAKRYDFNRLPPKVDLRKYMTEVEDQGETSSCVANAVAGAYEYLAKRYLDADSYDVSRLFIYYNARAKQESQDEDDGSYICDAIESLKEYGACSEDSWPFDEEYVNEQPTDEAYEEAAGFLVEDIENVPVDVNVWRHCLAEGYPIIFGISLYKSFDKHKKPGVVPMPLASESSRESHGGHAMLCVGYSDTDKLFIVRNSWGSEWGDDGYCYIPYNYLCNAKFNPGDCWIIKQLDNFDVDADTWGDEESIVEDLETELANMSEEDYNDMLEAMGEYPLEFRIGLIMLYAAGADEEISDDEYTAIGEYLEDTLNQIGVNMSGKKLLKNCWKKIEDEELFDESMALLGQYLSKPMLAKIATDVETIVGTDELSEDEENFVYYLISTWQIEEHFSEEEESEEEGAGAAYEEEEEA